MDKKKLNKIIIWIFLWTAIGWASAFASSKKWKSFLKQVKKDIKSGLKEMKNFFQDLKKKYAKKK